ncbi:DUF58 domain-containing protein [Cryobacterium sp. MLB-32]|uniref:DUF58 domain-containing protein n=1 Tax=Cryobacterium sp. MLB-32 TaxID=1529318 RepID=UPI000691F661|nr:DUF58 domain-containing protein [Cryobacterium sp. MLB-32]
MLASVAPLSAVPLSAVRERLRTVTGFGRALVVVGVLGLIIGRWLGWQEFTALAAVALALLALAVPFVLGRNGYDVRLDLGSNRVVVGEQAVGQVSVRNASRRALLPVRIELPVGAGLAAFQVPRLAADGSHDDLFVIPTRRRAVLVVGPVRSVRGDPLGLLRRSRENAPAVTLFVHPRTVRLDGSATGLLRDLEGTPTAHLSSDDMSFHALRQYVPGDDLRNVHWRSFARTGTVMVRQFEQTRRSHVAVALSRNPADYGTAPSSAEPAAAARKPHADESADESADQFELAISVCGSIGLQAVLDEKQLTVLTQEKVMPVENAARLLDGLAGLDREGANGTGSARDVVHLARHIGRIVPNASVVVLVFGAAVEPARIRAACRVLPQGIRVIAVRCVPGAALARGSMGATDVLTVGDLSDLPLGLRRVIA